MDDKTISAVLRDSRDQVTLVQNRDGHIIEIYPKNRGVKVSDMLCAWGVYYGEDAPVKFTLSQLVTVIGYRPHTWPLEIVPNLLISNYGIDIDVEDLADELTGYFNVPVGPLLDSLGIK